MSTQPMQQGTILLSRALGGHIHIDHLYRYALVDKFQHYGSALWVVHEISDVELGIAAHQDGNTSRRRSDHRESVLVQTVKHETRG